VNLPVSAAVGVALFGLPEFRSPNRGAVAVTLQGDSPRLLTFVTRDGGQSWSAADSVALPAGDYNEPVPIALSASGRLLAFGAQGSVTLTTGAAPRTFFLARRDGAPPAGAMAVSVLALSLADNGSCWILDAQGACEAGGCRQVTRLMAVDGSGRASEHVVDLLVRTEEEVQL
jgi:photosystem II stability/assembly factor-like uncharacterized protein